MLSTEIFLAVNGEYNQQKAAALSLVLLVPTLTIFILQRYYVSRRSYISVTGKPTTGRIYVKEPLIRWSFIIVTVLTLVLVLVLYLSMVVGSFTRLWGIDYTLDLSHYSVALGRGLNAILSTTFLSAVATPIAGLVGMVTAFMVVRKTFAGKQTLDFVSNLGRRRAGHHPGHRLHHRLHQRAHDRCRPRSMPCWPFYMVSKAVRSALAAGCDPDRSDGVLGYGINWLPYFLGLTENGWRILLAVGFLLTALVAWFVALPGHRLRAAVVARLLMAACLIIYNLSAVFTTWLSIWGRTLPGLTLPKIVTRISASIAVITQPTMTILGYTFLVVALYAILQVRESSGVPSSPP